MKIFIRAVLMLALCVLASGDDNVRYEIDGSPADIRLPGRERPVILPYNVYVKEFASSVDGGVCAFLLYRYRNSDQNTSDYFSTLICKKNSSPQVWKVSFVLNQAEMIEVFGGAFRVVELGPLESQTSFILKIAAPSNSGPEGGEQMNWEKWDMDSQSRIEIIRATKPFEAYK